MPERENIHGRVNIAFVSDTELTACPFSYSKPRDTFRPRIGQGAATRTGLGGVRLVNFFENNTCVSAFVFQHCFLHAPARVQHRLRHLI